MDKSIDDLLHKSMRDNDIVHMTSFTTADRTEQIINSELSDGEIITIIYNLQTREFRMED